MADSSLQQPGDTRGSPGHCIYCGSPTDRTYTVWTGRLVEGRGVEVVLTLLQGSTGAQVAESYKKFEVTEHRTGVCRACQKKHTRLERATASVSLLFFALIALVMTVATIVDHEGSSAVVTSAVLFAVLIVMGVVLPNWAGLAKRRSKKLAVSGLRRQLKRDGVKVDKVFLAKPPDSSVAASSPS